MASQDLDVCIRIERPIASQSDAWVWMNMAHSVNNVSKVYLNNSYTSWLENESRFVPFENGSWLYTNNPYEEWYPDWFDIKDKFTHYSYNGDEFYCLKNVYAIQNRKYELKLDFAFPYEKLNSGGWGCDEKFGLVAKRSSELLSDAISLSHFVELDPSFLADYGNRQAINFVGSSSYIPNGAFVLISADTTGWTTQDNFQDVRVTDNNNVEMDFVNLSTKTNDTVFIVETGQAYEPSTNFDWYFYFNAPSNSTPPMPISKLDWAYVPSDGEGNKHYVYDFRQGNRFELPMVGTVSSIILSDNGFGANKSVNTTAVASNTGLNCTTALEQGVFDVSYAEAVSYELAYDGVNTGSNSFSFYVHRTVSPSYVTMRHVFQSDAESSFGFLDGSWFFLAMDSPAGETTWSATVGTTDIVHRVTYECDTADCDIWVDDGIETLNIQVGTLIGSYNYSSTVPDSCGILFSPSPEYPNQPFIGDMKFLMQSSVNRVNLTYSTPPSYTFGSEESANTAPSNPVVHINSTSPTLNDTAQDIECSFVPIDDDIGEVLNAEISWFNNSVLAFEFNDTVTQDLVYKAVLTNENTTKNEEWNCQIKLCDDSSKCSNYINSSSITILDSFPRIQIVKLVNTTNYPTRTIRFEVNATDTDSVNEILNATIQIGGTEINLTSSEITGNDVVYSFDWQVPEDFVAGVYYTNATATDDSNNIHIAELNQTESNITIKALWSFIEGDLFQEDYTNRLYSNSNESLEYTKYVVVQNNGFTNLSYDVNVSMPSNLDNATVVVTDFYNSSINFTLDDSNFYLNLTTSNMTSNDNFGLYAIKFNITALNSSEVSSSCEDLGDHGTCTVAYNITNKHNAKLDNIRLQIQNSELLKWDKTLGNVEVYWNLIEGIGSGSYQKQTFAYNTDSPFESYNVTIDVNKTTQSGGGGGYGISGDYPVGTVVSQSLTLIDLNATNETGTFDSNSTADSNTQIFGSYELGSVSTTQDFGADSTYEFKITYGWSAYSGEHITTGEGGAGGGVVFKEEITVVNISAKAQLPKIDTYVLFLYKDKTTWTRKVLIDRPVTVCIKKDLFNCEFKAGEGQVTIIKDLDIDNKFMDLVKGSVEIQLTTEEVITIPITLRLINLGWYIPTRDVKIPSWIAPITFEQMFKIQDNTILKGVRVWWIISLGILIFLYTFLKRRRQMKKIKDLLLMKRILRD